VAVYGLISSSTPGPSSAAVRGQNNGTGGNGIGVQGYQAGTGAGVYGSVAGAGYGVHGEAGPGGDGVYGHAPGAYSAGVTGGADAGVGVQGTSTTGTGVWGRHDGTDGNGIGVYGRHAGSGVGGYFTSVSGNGVYGQGSAYGVYGSGSYGVYGLGSYGVYGQGSAYGLYGNATGSSSTGVYAEGDTYGGSFVSNDSTFGYGIVAGGATAYTTGFAGYFRGDIYADHNLYVNGTIFKGANNFYIDHPVDPANMYLTHTSVESPDMKTFYDGVATLDAHGTAVVPLPAWFGALNRDCRYQLTAIGAAAAGLYIAQEVVNNQFTIAGGTPGMRVSWLVTGIRQDAWANAHRTAVETHKAGAEQGHYLHPELFGVSADLVIPRLAAPQRAATRVATPPVLVPAPTT
jgi:hypothetical protein